MEASVFKESRISILENESEFAAGVCALAAPANTWRHASHVAGAYAITRTITLPCGCVHRTIPGGESRTMICAAKDPQERGE